ncbi:MAG: prepilin-type N-terminal cleavage/methylation domain-containing protein [Lentisphaerales bacterium]|jgi:prepilin-type N-terminal cleavage/methylation domain-containing protein|nr:MAG: prepilin-type N-terminal cleavage/methylation domain-containing protein [Lentisphaerales bacterium]
MMDLSHTNKCSLRRLRDRHPPATGFTLLEVLIVVAILVVLMTVTASVFFSGLSVWGKARSINVGTIDALICIEYFERDLRNASPFYSIELRGRSELVSFPQVLEGGYGDSPVRQVRYEFDERTRTVARFVSPFPMGGGEPGAELLVSNVKSMRLRYAPVPEVGSSALRWQDVWEGGHATWPAAVRIDLVLDEAGEGKTISRTIDLPLRIETLDEEEAKR